MRAFVCPRHQGTMNFGESFGSFLRLLFVHGDCLETPVSD